MGFKIFQRDRRGAEETKAGAELLEQLEEVWKLWKEMREELGEYRELKKGTVTIGIPMNLGACILPVVVPVFRRRYPGVKVFIRENNSQELEKMMLSHKVDFCIMHFQKALDEVCYDELSGGRGNGSYFSAKVLYDAVFGDRGIKLLSAG